MIDETYEHKAERNALAPTGHSRDHRPLPEWRGFNSVSAGQKAEPKKESVLSKSAPRAPKDPDLQRLEAAVEEAREQVRALEEEIAQESEKNGAVIVEEQRAVAALRDEKRQIETRLRQLDTDAQELDGQSTVAQELQKLEDAFESLTGEVESQALDIKERFTGTLFAAQYPELLETVAEIGPGSTSELEARVDDLLGLFDTIMTHSQEVGVFKAPVQIGGTTGTVKDVDVMRLGLMGGFYSDPDTAESGFVLIDSENEGSFLGESAGISSAQRSQIAALVEDPAAGGFLPLDVTGGAGIATLQQSDDSFARWFEVGGVFMYPLVAIALIALTAPDHRARRSPCRNQDRLVLRRGDRRRFSQLVEADKMDEAQIALSARSGGVGRQACSTRRSSTARPGIARSSKTPFKRRYFIKRRPSTRGSASSPCARLSRRCIGLLGHGDRHDHHVQDGDDCSERATLASWPAASPKP